MQISQFSNLISLLKIYHTQKLCIVNMLHKENLNHYIPKWYIVNNVTSKRFLKDRRGKTYGQEHNLGNSYVKAF